MSPDRLAVVVLLHDSGDDAVACVSALRDMSPAEIVVIDNASTDGVPDRMPDGITLIRNATNLGFAVAANQGIRATTAPYVLLINPDTTIEPGALDALQDALDATPRAAAIGALVRNPDGSVQPTRRAFPSLWQSIQHGFIGIFRPGNKGTRGYTLSDEAFTELSRVDWVAMTATALRRDAFEAVGGFDEAFFFFVEDVDLCRRLTDAGFQIWFQPAAVVVHRWGGSWTKRPLYFLWLHQRNVFRYVTKHYRGAWVLLYPVIGIGLVVRFVLLALRWLITRRSVPEHRSVT